MTTERKSGNGGVNNQVMVGMQMTVTSRRTVEGGSSLLEQMSPGLRMTMAVIESAPRASWASQLMRR